MIERAARCFVEDDSLGTSAELGYRFFLALVPFCLFLTSLSGFVATVLDMPDAAGRITSLVSTAVPSNVGGALSSEMQRVLSERRPGHLSLSLLFTLFAATGATNALIKAMNRAYAVAESRPFLRRYLLAVILTLFAAAAVIVGFTVLVAVRFFTAVVASSLGLATEHATFVGLLPLPIAVAALVLGAGALYSLGPNVRIPLRSVAPGAAFFATAWLGTTYAFSLYVDTLGSYELTYGALGSVVVLLIWLYITAAILLAGNQLNVALRGATQSAMMTSTTVRTTARVDAASASPGPTALGEREELRRRLSEWLDVPLTVLAVIALSLIVLELVVALPPDWRARVGQLLIAIWVIFAIAFFTELALAPAKVRYLRENWLTALSVVLPAFRAMRIFRAARLLRGFRLMRIVTAANRATRSLQVLAAYARYRYVAAVTLIVAGSGAAGVYYFEATEQSSIATIGDATWWAATTITTINSGLDPVTFEGRVIGVLLRIYGLAVSGYLTATIAVYLLGPRPESPEVAALRREVAELRAQARWTDA